MCQASLTEMHLIINEAGQYPFVRAVNFGDAAFEGKDVIDALYSIRFHKEICIELLPPIDQFTVLKQIRRQCLTFSAKVHNHISFDHCHNRVASHFEASLPHAAESSSLYSALV